MTTYQSPRSMAIGAILVLALLLTGCGTGTVTAGWAGITVEGSNFYLAYRDRVLAFAGGDTPVTFGDADAADPTWSQDGTKRAYTLEADGYYQLFVQAADGDPVQVTDNPADHRTPAFAPGGDQLVYEAGGDLYIFDLSRLDDETYVPFQLTDTAAVETGPDWSPDGTRIVYVSDAEDSFDLYTIAPDGSAAQRLTRTTTDEAQPAWSPDGNLIAYVSDLDGNNDIYIVDGEGKNRFQVTEDPADDVSPSWSAKDGAYILFASNRAGGYDLYTVVPRPGAIPAAFTESEIDELNPQWQPGDEGKAQGWVLYQATDETGVSQIYRTRERQTTSFTQPAWQFPAQTQNAQQQQYYAPPTIAGDRLYIGGYDRLVHAVDITTGEPILLDETDDQGNRKPWVTEQLPDIVADSVTVGEGLIYVPVANRNVMAFRAEKPELVWTFETGHGVWAKPMLLNGVLYVTSLDHHVYAVDAETGAEIWQTQDLSGAVPGRATLDAGRGLIYVGTLNSQVYAVDMADGSVARVFDADDWVWSSPILYDNTLYFGDMAGWLYALSADDWGNVLWKVRVTEQGGIRSSPLVMEDVIYVAASDGYLRARKRADGSNLWRAPSSEVQGQQLLSQPVYLSGVVLVSPMNAQNSLVAYDAETGSPAWSYNPNPEQQQ
ncbi:MAG: PQQ-binding-like beta-propeller repeat protein [Anaerolineae bacterium]|nr:PQQ-binding-like beta-propeller repeat protein [Anaerolineae bacterium]